MCLWLIVDQNLLPPESDLDIGWKWERSHVRGLRSGESMETMSLDRTCELLLLELDSNQPASSQLWSNLEDQIMAQLLEPYLNSEVASFEVTVVSDADMTYRQFQWTASLDLEVLSDPATV